jgi:hypothetical protein
LAIFRKFLFLEIMSFSAVDDSFGHPIDSSPKGYFHIFKVLNLENFPLLEILSSLNQIIVLDNLLGDVHIVMFW